MGGQQKDLTLTEKFQYLGAWVQTLTFTITVKVKACWFAPKHFLFFPKTLTVMVPVLRCSKQALALTCVLTDKVKAFWCDQPNRLCQIHHF